MAKKSETKVKETKKNKIKETKKTKEHKVKDLENVTPKKKKKSTAYLYTMQELLVVVIVTCLISSITTASVLYFKNRSENAMTRHRLNKDEGLTNFVNLYADILKNYYEDVDKDGMINSATKAMLNYLGDDYTSYLSEDQTEALNEKLDSTYEGIGVQVTGNIIYSVFDDSPAAKAGLKKGDVIKKIDEIDITLENYTAITDRIKEEDKDEFKLVIDRNGEELEIIVSKATIDSPVVDYTLIDNTEIGYLSISTFSNSASKQVESALKHLKEEGMKSLIIDVRNNTGGYLKSASDISKLFLEKGKVIYSLESKNRTKDYVDDTSTSANYDIVVLVNEASASSSEILAAALKDSYGATIVGNTTYGKGKVQTTKGLENGTMVKYTSSRWLRPNGECIDGVGIIPDYEVKKENNSEGIDNQLEKAIELLS